ncbi:SPS3 [Scenedesmus sp. PABB004]|nr:SPS3 [Scenedesmus sp. PABB004]
MRCLQSHTRRPAGPNALSAAPCGGRVPRSAFAPPAGRAREALRARVLVSPEAAPASPAQPARPAPADLLGRIASPVVEDMATMNRNLRSIVGERHPMLMAAADQIFGAGGKKLRPMIVFLVARATAELAGMDEITERHRRLAEIIEMIHTASLVHDDVLDDCAVRRGKDTVNTLYGSRVAVLVGDYLFAQASWLIANLENLEVIKLISKVIADFANGEISQASSLFDTGVSLEAYLDKSFYKTASLIAASCRSSAAFSGMPEESKAAMYDYGKHLGLAFQVVDDILDFTQSSEQLGKPQGQDLASGNLTAPVIFALRSSPELEALIQSEFTEDGSLQAALGLVHGAGGIEAARALAEEQGQLARAALRGLADCPAKRSLELMVDYVLERIH